MDITAVIDDWHVDTRGRFVIWGNIRGDKGGRFSDGTYIHTSRVNLEEVELKALKEGDIVETLNSTYLLGRKYE